MGANIGWLFYKDYFKEIDYAKLNNPKNEMLINTKVTNIINQTPKIEEAEVLGNTHFRATTTYPGLLLGSGNTHELPDIKGQAILGFHFDYTSGLPVIQGSSIKGVLRSAFKHGEYVQELLKNETLNVKTLEKEIFDNNDIFFDATISSANGKILGDDYITPHANELKDPIPLRFIKVVPNVTFRFDFELHDGLITKEQKSKLFQEILEDLGLGAKTNVGYGKFEHFNNFKSEKEKEEDNFISLLNSTNAQHLQNFINSNKNHPRISEVENRLITLEKEIEEEKFTKINEDAQKAYENATSQKDKNKRKQWLQAWITKWEKEKEHKGSTYVLELVSTAKSEL
jgi:CRISPR-associated protein Cmr6